MSQLKLEKKDCSRGLSAEFVSERLRLPPAWWDPWSCSNSLFMPPIERLGGILFYHLSVHLSVCTNTHPPSPDTHFGTPKKWTLVFHKYILFLLFSVEYLLKVVSKDDIFFKRFHDCMHWSAKVGISGYFFNDSTILAVIIHRFLDLSKVYAGYHRKSCLLAQLDLRELMK